MNPWDSTAAAAQPGFPISTSYRGANDTPAALTFQARIDIDHFRRLTRVSFWRLDLAAIQ